VSKLIAVALDCEMAGVTGGAGEAILLCVTDYVTGAVLINQYVCPNEPITQIRSSIHGISKGILEDAIQQGQTLWGWEGARSELWKYIDSNTIIVGHALEHDLDALRMIHPRIVDSGILSRKAVGIHRIRWGLQTLCSELVNIGIRKNKGAIHDCLEDVWATREVVLFCTTKKEAFQTWGEAKRVEELRLEKERERIRQEKQSRNNVVTAGSDSDDEREEVLNWSDMAEDLGWPHPDTGYSPWSD
jgi:DNA polymerase III epsilon subunit-like protein